MASAQGVDFVCVASPDDRHFAAAKAVLLAGKHLLVEKPSVLSLAELDELNALARQENVLAKVVYHKLLDPDHKRLRTLVADGELKHVNHGYCSLLEPKSIGAGQFSEWIRGRNPGTYVAVHYIKLIDFTFGGRLRSVACTGQRGIVGPADGNTWDSTQLRLGLPIRRWPRGGFRHSYELGHARQFSRLRRAGGAIPVRQRRLERPWPPPGRGMHDRRPHAATAENHAEPPLQCRMPGALGGAVACAAMAWRRSNDSSVK